MSPPRMAARVMLVAIVPTSAEFAVRDAQDPATPPRYEAKPALMPALMSPPDPINPETAEPTARAAAAEDPAGRRAAPI